MIKFEKVSRLAAADFNLPVRKTKSSAGYDFEVAEDIIVPTWTSQLMNMTKPVEEVPADGVSLDWLAALTKTTKAKPTLVSTGNINLTPFFENTSLVTASKDCGFFFFFINATAISKNESKLLFITNPPIYYILYTFFL